MIITTNRGDVTSVTVMLQALPGYVLPESVTVEGASAYYNSGVLMITDLTSEVEIDVESEEERSITMSNMFINYNNIPGEYIPNNMYPPKPLPYMPQQRPLEEYNIKGEFIGFSWHYNDHIVLQFVTDGFVTYDNDTYEDAEDYLTGKVFEIILYNFRYEAISKIQTEASSDISINIESDLAVKLVPGLYYMSVTLVDEENNVRQTLLDYDSLKFIVR